MKQSNLQRNCTLTAAINHWQLQEVLLLKSALAIKNVSAEFIVVEEGQAMLGQRTATDLGKMEHVNTMTSNTGNLKTRVVEKFPKVFTGVREN